MLDNISIYKKILVEGGLNNVKHLRDQWNYNRVIDLFSQSNDLCDICGVDANQYCFIVQEAKDNTLKTIHSTILALLHAYEIDFKQAKISVGNKTVPFSFLQNGTLYLFCKSGIQWLFLGEELDALREQTGFIDFKYIIPIEGNAFAEQINHNDDETDLSRGTHIFTLEQFFGGFFPSGEYAIFKKYFEEYVQAVRSYFGLSVVKTLRPNSLFSYKCTIREKMHSFNYQMHLREFCPQTYLSNSQKALLDSQFFENGFSAALTGKLPFAKCFMTAEWLYDSFLETAGAIDLSAVSMGYFKAIEQFLYDFVGFHTTEKDGKPREIMLKRGSDPVSFTDEVYCNHKRDLSLGTMSKYLRQPMQTDLLRQGVDRYTAKLVRELLSQASGFRNEYFHKDNISEWETIEKDRALTYLLFYFVLGAYEFDGPAFDYFGFEKPVEKSDWERLFEYSHIKSFQTRGLEVPILYFSENKFDFYFPAPDNYIQHDEYGDPTYSGMYYYQLGNSEIVRKIDSENLPSTVWEGKLKINRDLSFEPTGPEKLIFKDGKFLGA